ncbi:MAG TPA: hypothetical protein IAB06_00195 [Candidatus Avacidaminococcus intestinavium]|uniref:Uncharacterized protein n=1 Tax=Candidatus Avacidaminococcus intestinavium TaxID=2840684 RepID=A0A9D1MNW5_9FIRM|nr:hypothetical protein [Candidatus Avacidaminococcus intestinavium]
MPNQTPNNRIKRRLYFIVITLLVSVPVIVYNYFYPSPLGDSLCAILLGLALAGYLYFVIGKT